MKELQKIKEIILNIAKEMNIEIDKIILFGSRARGDYREDSDYDLLIITKEKLEKEKKIEFWYKIYKKIEIPADIIIVSKDVVEKFKEHKGFIYSYALAEGKVI